MKHAVFIMMSICLTAISSVWGCSDNGAGGGGATDTDTDSDTDGDTDTDSDSDTDTDDPPDSLCDDWELPAGGVFYVATDGSDESGDGSSSNPWATITQALDSVPDDSTVQVRPGLYQGRVRIRGTFTAGVTVRSEQPYLAQLRHNETVVTAYAHTNGCEGITLAGFDIAHDGTNPDADTVIHIGGDGDGTSVSRLMLLNNVIHDSDDNDLIKLNHSAVEVIIARNMFYNQVGPDEHIDINSVRDVIVQDNVFFNDFAGSGKTNGNDTSSYVLVKDSSEDDVVDGSQSIFIRRNVFLNWEGSDGQSFVRMTESGGPIHEAVDVTVENNLLLGNAINDSRTSFQVSGGRNISFCHNTVVGDLPGLAYAMRLNGNPPNEDIEFRGNIWSDPTGTMGAESGQDNNDFSDADPAGTLSFVLDGNLYWNGSEPIPEDAAELVNYTDDAHGVVSDPLLGDQAGLVIPRWVAADGTFADGSATITEAFERLVLEYGIPGPGSGAVDAALADGAPAEDILCQPRGDSPDIGAYEVQ
jgi:hypothetical protein